MNHKITSLKGRLFAILGCCGFLMALPSCQWLDSDQESYVFVFVENLGFDAVSCGREREYQPSSGFHLLCEDSVQFSHAYSNSPLSPVALASFFTAATPGEHGAGAGAAQFLSSEYKILSEAAWDRGLHTWMFSGGAPIFKKGGFSQGFEVFEDHISLHQGQVFKPFKENLNTFFRLTSTQRKPGVFAVFYVPDLTFHESETVDPLGLPRERSYEGQLEEFNENLGSLFQNLKARKVWSKTHIVVAGLNSKPLFDRPGEVLPTNLYSERVHVALFIKPARAGRGEHPQSWRVNHNVSLMDLGATYFDWIEGRFAAPRSPLAAASLKGILTDPGAGWNAFRPLEIVSDWAEWRSIGNVRRSLRIGNDFYLFDSEPVYHNTLVDRMEMSPQALDQEQTLERWSEIYEEPLDLWLDLDPPLMEKIRLSRFFFGSNSLGDPLTQGEIEKLLRSQSMDFQLGSWLGKWALDRKNWELLEMLGRSLNQPFWVYVAAAHLHKELPDVASLDCGSLFLAGANLDRRATFRDCRDGTFVELINWVRDSSGNRQAAMEVFLKDFFKDQAYRRLAQLNYLKGLSWDVSIHEPGGPSLSELYLNLPQKVSLWRQVQARMRSRSTP